MSDAKFARGRGSQLTGPQRRDIQELALLAGCSQAEIARRTGRDRGTVKSVLDAADTQELKKRLADAQPEEARAILKLSAVNASRRWNEAIDKAAEKGDHRPAKDLLLHTGVIAPVQIEKAAQMNVAVVLGSGAIELPPSDD